MNVRLVKNNDARRPTKIRNPHYKTNKQKQKRTKQNKANWLEQKEAILNDFYQVRHVLCKSKVLSSLIKKNE